MTAPKTQSTTSVESAIFDGIRICAASMANANAAA